MDKFKMFLIGFFGTGVFVNLMMTDKYGILAVIYISLASGVVVFWPKKEININFKSIVDLEPVFSQKVNITNKNKKH